MALMNFDLPKLKSSIIKVIGVGGGGSNAVNYMYKQDVEGVDFIVCNTDAQALEQSPIPNKVQLGVELTEGLGAGSKPEKGREAAVENLDQLKEVLGTGTKMVFITAGMGGGTGTGAAPVIAKLAQDLGILTVGIVTLPFGFEGRMRKKQAEEGIEELRQNVDTLLVVCNDRLRQMYGNLTLTNAFAKADDVLSTASRGIAEIVIKPGFINVDFNDVKTVMTKGGAAIMGYATASGENRALNAVEMALSSPLLNDNSIKGSKQILVNISSGRGEFEATMDEIAEITDYVYEQAGDPETLIHGVVYDDNLNDEISVIVIATHLEENPIEIQSSIKDTKKITHTLNVETPKQNPFVAEIPKVEEEIKVRTLSPEEVKEKQNHVQSSGNKLNIGKTVFYNKDEDKVEEAPQKIVYTLQDDLLGSSNFYDEEKEEKVEKKEITNWDKRTEEEKDRSYNDRISKLRAFTNRSLKTNDPDSLREIEETPAFIRNKVKLDSIKHSSESEVSRFTLSDDSEGYNLKENNSFLDDNVD